MSTVADAPVLVAALIDTGPSGEWAERILAGGSLHAPELARVEATGILRRLERAKKITTPKGNEAHEDLMQLSLVQFSFDPFDTGEATGVGRRTLPRIPWELRHTITSYDAWYVAVAEALDLPLATLDERLAKAKGINCDCTTPRGRSRAKRCPSESLAFLGLTWRLSADSRHSTQW